MVGSIRQRIAASVLVLSAVGVGAIVKHEGMVKTAYVDPVGVVTVCAGHTRTAKLGQTLSPERCAELLKADTEYAQAAVRRLVTAKITQQQFDALTSLVFNIGEGNFARSSLLRKINAQDCWGAGSEFPKWNKGRVNGKLVELRGLTLRRADERKTFETGCVHGTNQAAVKQKADSKPAPAKVRACARRPEHDYSHLLALAP